MCLFCLLQAGDDLRLPEADNLTSVRLLVEALQQAVQRVGLVPKMERSREQVETPDKYNPSESVESGTYSHLWLIIN